MPINQIIYQPPGGAVTTLSLVAVHGTLKLPMADLKEVKNPAVNGLAYKRMGVTAPDNGLVLEAVVANEFSEASLIYTMAQLVGLQVTVYTATGTWQAGVVVKSMDHVDTIRLATGRWQGTDVGTDARLLIFNMGCRYPYGS